MRWLLALLFVPLSVVSAAAHFVFVVPAPDARTAAVLLSENLKPDPAIDIGLVGGAALSIRDAQGRETAATLTKGDHQYTVALEGAVARLVHGTVDLGVMKTGDRSFVLVYHPKTILGDAFAPGAALGADAPVELTPLGREGAVRLQLLVGGHAQAGAEVTVILPDGSQKKMTTDGDGRTETLAGRGRFGAWARYWESAKGQRDGTPYDEVRHYATLVFDSAATSAARRVATLPEPTSSFGAVASNGWLYVYGGHVARTHTYATTAVSIY
jgi:hypothetical protein